MIKYIESIRKVNDNQVKKAANYSLAAFLEEKNVLFNYIV